MKVLDYNGLSYFWNKLKALLTAKQDTLVSSMNIKTVEGQSVLGGGDLELNAVSYASQTLTNAQKQQARTNIAAASNEDMVTTSGQVDNLVEIVEDIESRMSSIITPKYSIAWDGVSTPNVASIPNVCVVTYGGETYTGTLAASSSNVNTIFLVGDDGGSSYLRYLCSSTSNGYGWMPLGSTTIDMDDYVRKDSEVWLTQQAFEVLTYKDPNVTYNVYEEDII